MYHNVGKKIKAGVHRVGVKLHNTYHQGQKFMNKPGVKAAVAVGAAGLAVAKSMDSSKKPEPSNRIERAHKQKKERQSFGLPASETTEQMFSIFPGEDPFGPSSAFTM